MKAYILSGMSGSGKSLALKYLEDMGLTCIDNIPQSVIPNLIDAFVNSKKNIVITVDIRSSDDFDANALVNTINKLKKENNNVETIYLDASNETIINRYHETRRVHPLCGKGVDTKRAVEIERHKLSHLKENVTHLIDTSHLKPKELKSKLEEICSIEKSTMKISIISFGFKRGIPEECDLVFDVRIMPNPFYISQLSHNTGLDENVKEYVLNNDYAKSFLTKLEDMLKFLIPCYVDLGKQRLVIGIGCTGGAHRSVAISEEIACRLKDYNPKVNHRDIQKEKALWEQ